MLRLKAMLLAIAGAVILGGTSGAWAGSAQYGYDPLGRLIQVTNSDGSSRTYNYDAAGNRTTSSTTAAAGVPSGTFYAGASSIAQGQSTTLNWTSTNATSAIIDQGVGAVSPASGGSVTVAPNASTSYTLTLAGSGGSVSYSTYVTVTPGTTNRPPVAVDDYITVTGGGFFKAVVFNPTANDTDPDGDPLEVISVTDGALGLVANSPNGVRYSVPRSTTGTDQFTYTISDGHGHTATATVHVTIP